MVRQQPHPGDWADIWLNEGFACYAEWLWAEHADGVPVRASAQTHWSRLARLPQDLVLADPGPVLMFDDRVYKRGALTLHALRLQVGDGVFFELLRDWVQSHRHGSVTTDEFVDLVERARAATRRGGAGGPAAAERAASPPRPLAVGDSPPPTRTGRRGLLTGRRRRPQWRRTSNPPGAGREGDRGRTPGGRVDVHDRQRTAYPARSRWGRRRRGVTNVVGIDAQPDAQGLEGGLLAHPRGGIRGSPRAPAAPSAALARVQGHLPEALELRLDGLLDVDRRPAPSD